MTPTIPSQTAYDIVSHHLRLFGAFDKGIGCSTEHEKIRLHYQPESELAKESDHFLEGEGIVLAITPTQEFCDYFNVNVSQESADGLRILHYKAPTASTMPSKPWQRLRSLHGVNYFAHGRGKPIVVPEGSEKAAWLLVPHKQGVILFIGTDLPQDLIRFRQGDPQAIQNQNRAMWGFETERPVYLFEPQLEEQRPSDRQADWWMKILTDILREAGIPLQPLLPGSSRGAIVITGDDDQAFLEKYEAQAKVLKGLPITYFLHPQTRHTPKSLSKLNQYIKIDLGLHPDALDAPNQYGQLLGEQVEWYKRLTQEAPFSLRNHGFLNDGYWGHLPHWLKHNIQISSNLPGLNGRVINGSLLPARLSYKDCLTSHWSILTAIGDGIVFACQYNKEQAAGCIYGFAEQIIASDVPGVMVLNLHPQNIDETLSMHHAVRDVIRQGFHPWTLKECWEWFNKRDQGHWNIQNPQPPTLFKFFKRWFGR